MDAARLLDAEIVAGVAESGAKTEAGEVQPTRLVGWTLLAAVSVREEHIGERADRGEGPAIAAETHRLLQPGGQFLGRDGRFGGRRENLLDQLHRLLQCLLAHYGGGLALDRLRGRGFAQLELQAPAIVADLGFAPGLEGADLGEARAQFHGDQALFGLLAETDYRV